VQVKFNHTSWGEYSFTIVIPDYWTEDTIDYNPELYEWYDNLADQDNNNDDLTISWPACEYTSIFTLTIEPFNSDGALGAETTGNSYTFMPGNFEKWSEIADKIIDDEGLYIYLNFETKETLNWDNKANIYATGFSYQTWGSFIKPIDVSGTYDLVANYKTAVANTNNESYIITIQQEGTELSISSVTGSSGSIWGVSVSLKGDILTRWGSGGNQSFNGTVEGNTISGFISGTVMVKDYLGTLSIETITEGTFTLTKR
jgi:hypothetical protein